MSKFKRIHLFEIEDQSWFPSWIRDCMTRTIKVMHGLVKNNKDLPRLLAKVLKDTNTNKIIDLCSGGGGPMVEAIDILKSEYGLKDIQLQMTDLFPHKKVAEQINNKNDSQVTYLTQPVNALKVPASKEGLRTMICSFHHMRPSMAKQILKNAQDSQQPILMKLLIINHLFL